MRKTIFIILLLSLIFLYGCSSNNWTGFYYSDKNNIGDESTWTIKSGFWSLDDCRNRVNDVAGNNQNFDYECWYKCEYNNSYGTNICKETIK